ncbi:MAG: NADH dehydrogenase subunit, partial [Mucinivorans sp.]
PDSMTFSLVEGVVGPICHLALTDGHGELEQYKVYDPSLHNWPLLALSMRGGQISDFPLSNKSFELSYSGTDL